MKAGWFKNTGKNPVANHGLCYIIILLFLVLLIPATAAVTKNDHSASFDLFSLYIYPAAIAFWWKWVA